MNKVYSFTGASPAVPFGTAYTLNWNLNNPNRRSLIKSIFYDLYVFDIVTFQKIPWETATTMFPILTIGASSNIKIAQAFSDITAGFLAVNGNGITFLKPMQLLFDSFYIANVLPCRFVLTNNDAAINVAFTISVVIEIKDTGWI